MNKKCLCIAGAIYDLVSLPVDYFKPLVQQDLNFKYGNKTVLFDISENFDGSYILTFKRHFSRFYNPTRTPSPSGKTVFLADAYIILGKEIQDNNGICNFDNLESNYVQYTPIAYLLNELKKESLEWESLELKNLDIQESADEVKFIVEF